MDAIERYLKKCRIRNLSQGTIANYKLSLSTFRQFYPGEWDELTQDDVDDYILYLQDDDSKCMTTVNNRLRDLRTFLKWLHKEGRAEEIEIQLVRQDEPEIHAFSKQHLKDIYEACNLAPFTFSKKRDKTLMRLLELSGCRLSEALNINVKEVDLKNLVIPLGKTKNKRTRVIYLTPALAKEVNHYLNLRQQVLYDNNLTATKLFITRKGTPLCKRTIQERIQRYGELAGITDVRVSPHTFRHTFAKNYLIHGGDIFTLKDILGHSSLDMVYRYARLFDTERQNQYQAVMKRYSRHK